MDDEYFRLAITTGIDPAKFPNEFDLSIRAIRKLGVPQKLGLAKTMLSNFSRKPIYTPAGLYLGEAGALSIDAARIQRVVSRIVRGLFFHHFGKRLPSAHTIWILSDWFTPNLADKELLAEVQVALDFLSSAEPREIGSGIFCYRHRILEDEPDGSIWWLCFYDHRRFLCSTQHTHGGSLT